MREPVRIDPAKNRRVAFLAAGVVAGMVGLSYASVPLYALFCQVTGFGGTTQRADAAPQSATTTEITIRFDANVSDELGWRFHPVQNTVKIKVGEQALAFYEAVNLSQKTVTGSAVFNVSPPEAGVFFNKIECFCFTEQTLKPGETAQFPVTYFVDPAMLEDPDTKSLREITLSYTFYPVEKPAVPKSASLTTN